MKQIDKNTVKAENQLRDKHDVTFECEKNTGIRVMMAGNSITLHEPSPTIGCEPAGHTVRPGDEGILLGKPLAAVVAAIATLTQVQKGVSGHGDSQGQACIYSQHQARSRFFLPFQALRLIYQAELQMRFSHFF